LWVLKTENPFAAFGYLLVIARNEAILFIDTFQHFTDLLKSSVSFLGAISSFPLQSFYFLKKKIKRIFSSIWARAIVFEKTFLKPLSTKKS